MSGKEAPLVIWGFVLYIYEVVLSEYEGGRWLCLWRPGCLGARLSRRKCQEVTLEEIEIVRES